MGTHRSQRFRDKLHEAEREEQMRLAAQAETAAERAAAARRGTAERAVDTEAAPSSQGGTPLERLCEALVRARRQTGEADLTRERIAELVRKQTDAIRARRGADAKVKFRVVVEDNKAKLKATVV
jgi:hypothetical protein